MVSKSQSHSNSRTTALKMGKIGRHELDAGTLRRSRRTLTETCTTTPQPMAYPLKSVLKENGLLVLHGYNLRD
ncbi:hypothetical protein C1H46_007125 [Malus baccata]|uniref:Uncharacterized protein n=1 Tax=Malus baccata TaxID=106549 RepID=A0A540N9Q5_MALBA|nr:hypothetical protein C1H46_007125 [Malus baccata]